METVENTQSNWYVLQVMSNMEKRVYTSIQNRREQDARNGIDDKIDDIKVPVDKVEKTVKERGGRTKVKVQERKRFPGYVLIQARLYDSQNKLNPDVWDLIKNTQGVIDFVGGLNPTKLTAVEVLRMVSSEEEAELSRPLVQFNVGERVSIKIGAFQGFEADIESIDNEHARLKVSVNIFGRATSVELANNEVEKIGDNKDSK